MDVRAELHALLDSMLDDDPRQALIAYRRFRDEEMPWIEGRAVMMARRENWKWAPIGRLLGCSRQNVQQRFAALKLVLRSDPDPDKHRAESEYMRLVTRHRLWDDDDAVAW